MSKAKELLLECKIKLGIKTDYKLAQALEIHTARVSSYMSEKEQPDTYTAVRMALILGRDPAEIIAEIEMGKEKNEKRREFWRNFLQHVQQQAKLFMLALICTATLCGVIPTKTGTRFFRA